MGNRRRGQCGVRDTTPAHESPALYGSDHWRCGVALSAESNARAAGLSPARGGPTTRRPWIASAALRLHRSHKPRRRSTVDDLRGGRLREQSASADVGRARTAAREVVSRGGVVIDPNADGGWHGDRRLSNAIWWADHLGSSIRLCHDEYTSSANVSFRARRRGTSFPRSPTTHDEIPRASE